LQRAPLPPNDARSALDAALESGDMRVLNGGLVRPGAYVMSAAGWRSLADRVRDLLASYHRQYPLRPGMPREELRSRLGLPAKVWPDVLGELVTNGIAVDTGTAIRLSDFAPTLSPSQRAEAERYLAALRAEPYAPSVPPPADPELLSYLVETGQAVRVSDNVVFAAEAYRAMLDAIIAHLRERGTVTVAEVRDLFATSRKFALGLLEHLDERRITRRQGDDRVLRDPNARERPRNG
jgi:selenocysteine-specific elongation factor